MNRRRSCPWRSVTFSSEVGEDVSGAVSPLSGQRLWSLLQLSDQLFPTGAYAFSHALEMYVAAGVLRDAHACQQLLADLCWQSIGPSDLVFCAHAYRLAAAPEATTLTALLELDRLVAATKGPRELRQESQQTGQAFLRAALTVYASPLLQALWQQVQQGRTPGHHALAFGVVAAALGIDADSALLGYLYNVMAGLVAAALRLVPLGQSASQQLLYALGPLCLEVIQAYRDLPLDEVWSATPGLDIRSMQHERLYSRLCRS
ncbi:MAG: urease accessory protein UreF [Candidatus Tectimicrobiota bacterium]